MLSARKAPSTGPGPHVCPTGASVVAGLAFVVLMIVGCTLTKTIRELGEAGLGGYTACAQGPHREVTGGERTQTWGSLPWVGHKGGVSRVVQVHSLVPN